MLRPEAARGASDRFIISVIFDVQSNCKETRSCGIVQVMDTEVTRGAACTTITNLDDVAQNVQLLSEKILQDIAKGQLVKLALNCDDSQ